MISKLWRAMKQQHRLRMGPAMLNLQFTRTPPLRPPPARPAARVAGAAVLPEGGALPEGSEQPQGEPPRRECALLLGVGPGLGEALASMLGSSGFAMGLVARDGVRLEAFAARIRAQGAVCKSYSSDVTLEGSVDAMFKTFEHDFGCPDLVVYGLQRFGPGKTADIEVPAFEEGWRHNCFGAFLAARRATQLMAARGHGTLLLIGSTSAVLGREDHLNLAVGKFGQRALAQVLSREVWPLGVHVVHVIIDADIREGEPEPFPQAEPSDVAQTLLFLHRQPRSAWTSEIDLRPWNERFWQHC
jgi:NAD(P)-dependent dehydrogenase (short-subunit alcohol dehydrogenase family)